MYNNNKFDVIIVGAGMGGLSAGAFLAKEGKSVLILEKHDKPGGYVTSFKMGDYIFDSAIFHLTDMGQNETIPQFIKFWGGNISSIKVKYKFKYFIGEKEYIIDSKNVIEELCNYFPDEKKAINNFFSLSNIVYDEALSGGAPKAPYEMKFFEKMSFGIKALIKMRNYLKYSKKHSVSFLKDFFKDKTIASIIWGYYPIHSLLFFAHIFGWVKVLKDEFYYPLGGLQAIPDATVKTLELNGGKILYKSEVDKILIKDKLTYGVRCLDGREYLSDIVISNAPIHHTFSKLLENEPYFDNLRSEIQKREIFVSGAILFLGIDETYDFEEVNFFIFLEEDTLNIKEENLTPQNTPIIMIILPKPKGQKGYSVFTATVLPYDFQNYWGTGDTKIRGKQYRKIKEDMKNTIINRLCHKLGEEFRNAINFSLASTPLTFERYAYNKNGSIMGWKMNKANYLKSIPQTTPVDNFYLVGHWVFPNFGVPGVMASGYYVAKTILRKENINLEDKFKFFFDTN